MRQQMDAEELDDAVGGARQKASNLVFLNIQKLDSLRTRRGEERTDYWDRGLRGFGVRVYPTGRKVFTVRYSLHGELHRRSLGVYRNARGVVGGEVSYSEARAEAERIISEARSGRDPFIGIALLRNADISTFEGLCERFLADPSPGRKGRVLSATTRAGLTRIVRKNWIHKATAKVLDSAGIEDARHHDTRRVIQTNMAELGVAPHVADMILNHAVKGAPKSRAHYDMYHYVPEKRDALTRWVQRLAEVLGHDPNDVMKVDRTGYQGRGPARKLGRRETYRARKAKLAAQGRDLAAERRQRSQEAARTRSACGS
jgi:hypothetical protein